MLYTKFPAELIVALCRKVSDKDKRVEDLDWACAQRLRSFDNEAIRHARAQQKNDTAKDGALLYLDRPVFKV